MAQRRAAELGEVQHCQTLLKACCEEANGWACGLPLRWGGEIGRRRGGWLEKAACGGRESQTCSVYARLSRALGEKEDDDSRAMARTVTKRAVSMDMLDTPARREGGGIMAGTRSRCGRACFGGMLRRVVRC